ncbi:MAG: prolyl-tRNA synthetase associated domain-containing protein [Candidatus Babeliales bacterium]|nr:prolyl-tRNA synthetase associated domain-containing protein [Candidatus Babeliales bacterium]
MKTKQDLLQYLQELNFVVKIYEHEPIFTAEQGKHLLETIPGAHCKNLFLIDDQGNYWLVVAEFRTKIDLKNLAKTLNVKKLQFGSPEKLQEYFGVTPGSVTPFGIINDSLNKVKLILDKKTFENEMINVHPLINNTTISIKPNDMIKFIKALSHDYLICEFL